MDPDVTYTQLMMIIEQIEQDLLPLSAHTEAIENATELAENLSAWLGRGGFYPRDYDPCWRTRTAEALAKIGHAPVAIDF